MKLGIDFGSTYSTVSAYNAAEGRVEALTLVEGEPVSIPSVVSVSKSGKVTCGKGAKDQIGKKTVQVYEAFKMLLTESNEEMLRRRGYTETVTPYQAAKYFLDSTLSGILGRYGREEEHIEEAVICVPEIWGKNVRTLDGRSILRKLLTEELGLSVPIDHVRVVTEPEAASAFFAYHYEQESGRSFNGHLLLIDYGGGTLDLTLTQVYSDGAGTMEIGYREGGGAGENHPDSSGRGAIGSAGIAYMQGVTELALREAGILGPEDEPDYRDPEFLASVRDLESQLKTADRIREIEDVFGSYSTYQEMEEILEDEPTELITLEYDGDEVPVTCQQLFRAYRDIIEPVLRQQVEEINRQAAKHLGYDPTQPRAGERDNFKIALVGGFGSFYLVRRQIEELYRLDPNRNIDLRTRNIVADKRELAISLGAALLAEGRVVLQKNARYSIGIYAPGSGRARKLSYGIRFHQVIEPGKPYFLCENDGDGDDPKNRITYAALYGNITHFAIEFSDRRNHGGLMKLKPEILRRLEDLPREGFWNLGFSLDESDIVSFHVVPRPVPGLRQEGKGICVALDSYSRMFDLTAVTEVTV